MSKLDDEEALDEAIWRLTLLELADQGAGPRIHALTVQEAVAEFFARRSVAWRRWYDDAIRRGGCRAAIAKIEALAKPLAEKIERELDSRPRVRMEHYRQVGRPELLAVDVEALENALVRGIVGASPAGHDTANEGADPAEIAEDGEEAAAGYLKGEVESAVKAFLAKREEGPRKGNMDECYRRLHGQFPHVSRERIREIWRAQSGPIRKGRPRKFAAEIRGK